MRDDDQSEGSYLIENGDPAFGGGNPGFIEEMFGEATYREGREEIRNDLRIAYSNASQAKVGAKMACPNCGKVLVKKSYQHKFCKPKRKGRSSCKDRYWNRVDPSRMER